MNHLIDFNSFNEGLFDIFSKGVKNPIKYREDMKVSKRLKENNIKQVFEIDPETNEENQNVCYLVWKDGEKEHKVAKISIDEMDEYGRPIFKLNILTDESKKINKFFLNQDSATHYFLNYWESQTPMGREKNKRFKLKKY